MPINTKYLRVTAFVGVWMFSGWFFHLSSEVYLLLGIPLVLLFQSLVRHQPIRALWVRDSDRFRLRPLGIVTAIVLMTVPACALPAAISQREWGQSAFFAAACVGAVGAGFSVQHGRLALSRRALLPFAAAILFGIVIMGIPPLLEARSPWPHFSHLGSLFLGFVTYIPVCFALEEVVFRGALDTDVWIPGGSRMQASLSAFLVSSLWGLWHLPTLGEQTPLSVLAAAPILILSHAFDGAFIAFSWRASGSLLLPAIYHSLVDAYRDTIWQ